MNKASKKEKRMRFSTFVFRVIPYLREIGLLGILMILNINKIYSQTSRYKFEDIFQEKKRIVLQESDDVLIGMMSDIAVDSDNNIIVADPLSHHIVKFSPTGQVLEIIGSKGKGPGEFLLPLAIELNSKDELFVLDLNTRRISVFDKSGIFIDSYVLTHLDGFAPLDIKFGPENDSIYLSGIKFSGVPNRNKIKGLYIHHYDNQFNFRKSFYPVSPLLSELNLYSESGVTFDIDEFGNLYIAEPIAYKVSKYSSAGDLISTFGRSARFYIPPSKFPEVPGHEKPKKLRAWFPSWTHLIKILCFRNLVMVQFRIHKPSQYLIEFYDKNGVFLMGEFLTDYKLICKDKNDKNLLYFLLSESPENYMIGTYHVNTKAFEES